MHIDSDDCSSHPEQTRTEQRRRPNAQRPPQPWHIVRHIFCLRPLCSLQMYSYADCIGKYSLCSPGYIEGLVGWLNMRCVGHAGREDAHRLPERDHAQHVLPPRRPSTRIT